ncbi:MFS transporter [Sphingobium sp. EM0848]|uniref:spinster family MFS transporter n=1 Tax=Sphingobium sp. EM0848 TaxID=2743473 RepID=UPI00159C0E4B|nr:MFS transporter [Sphingobium sp. EM0848]
MASLADSLPNGAIAASSSVRPRRQAFYVLALLCLISLLGYYDRYLIAILVESIKHDLGVSDGEVGLLTGFAFAFVYSIMAVPVARYSDGGRRVLVLGVSLLIWSAMTALCGFASSFAILLVARLGVGMGEAGGIPTTHALVSDTFPARWRATALSATVVIGGIGFMIANAAGGWVADHWGWRAAFLVGAAPAPLLALLLFTTVREPAVSARQAEATPASLWRAVGTLLSRRSYALLCLGMAVATVASSAMLNWIPAFLMRSHGMTAGQVGGSYGLIMGLATIAALLLGGVLGDALSRMNPRWGIRLPALAFCLTAPMTLAFLFTHDLTVALIIAAPMNLVGTVATTPAYALVQRLAGSGNRATATALYLLIVNLFGMGLGPALAGWISDALAERFGPQSLQYALALVSCAYLAGGLLIASGARSVMRDSAAANGA